MLKYYEEALHGDLHCLEPLTTNLAVPSVSTPPVPIKSLIGNSYVLSSAALYALEKGMGHRVPSEQHEQSFKRC